MRNTPNPIIVLSGLGPGTHEKAGERLMHLVDGRATPGQNGLMFCDQRA